MSNLPFDLQHQADEIEVSAEQESPRSRFLVGAVIVLLLLGLLAAVLFALMKSLESGRRLARIEALPVDALVQYSEFADNTQNEQAQLSSRISALEKTLIVAEGRLDHTDETSSTMKAALDQNRAYMDDLDKRLTKISDSLAAQQKSASELQRKLAQTHAQSQKPAARSDVQLYSVRSFGHVPAVRLTGKTGEISPLLRAGDQWNGWQFLRLDGRKAFFTANGREQVLVL
jgi:septal ring factor EnvC (AmiA/AmiB activator)